MIHSGFWLGVLDRNQLHDVGAVNYARAHYYYTDEYNKSGLWDWERKVIERDFAGCRKLLLLAAGGGREALALRKQGLEVDGFESDPGLLEFANGLLRREGAGPDLRWTPWDRCPEVDGPYDGVIVGWGAYMLIRGRARRVELLRAVRRMVPAGAPILLSFNTTGENSRFFRNVARVGNVWTRLLRRDAIEIGDSLTPNYEHYFTRPQVEGELVEGGFEPVHYERYRFGHSVGRAV